MLSKDGGEEGRWGEVSCAGRLERRGWMYARKVRLGSGEVREG